MSSEVVAIIVFIIIISISVGLLISLIAFMGGASDREFEADVKSPFYMSRYDNRYIAPFNYMYDIGYRSYDKFTLRAERNKKKFKRG